MSLEPIAATIAREFYSRLPASCTVTFEDLTNSAMLGALEIAGRFNPKRGTSFAQYARKRMRGAIADYLRREDHLSRRHRSVLKRVEEIEAKLGPGAPPSAIRAAAGVLPSQEHLLGLMSRAPLRISPTNDPDAPDVVTQIADKSKLADLKVMDSEVRKILGWTLSHLDRRSRRLMELYYYGDQTMAQIAVEMDIHETRVSQLHSAALAKCRQIFARRGVKEYQQLAA